jgi:hypothetical protein
VYKQRLVVSRGRETQVEKALAVHSGDWNEEALA